MSHALDFDRVPKLSKIASYGAEASLDEACSNVKFRNAQWSPDGTCILTNSGDVRGRLDTFVLPHDLLTNPRHHTLRSYSSRRTAESIYAFVPYPYFRLSEPSTTLVLSSSVDHPVQLTNALSHTSGVVASYPLISEKEDLITPASLAFTRDGTHFIAGSERYLSIFDVSRNGEAPLQMHKTIPSRKALKKVGGIGINGIISSLSINDDHLLAAGTLSRAVGIYSSEGRGESVALFTLDERTTPDSARLHGTGVSKLAWSHCGRYLYVAERRTDVMFLYDIRVSGRLLGTLLGRKANSNQRLDFDIVPTQDGSGTELWAGNTDGFIRIWKNPQHREGDIDMDWESLAHSDPVVSTLVHPSGSIVATCAAANRSLRTVARPIEDQDSDSQSNDSASDLESEAAASMHEDFPEGHEHANNSDLALWSIS